MSVCGSGLVRRKKENEAQSEPIDDTLMVFSGSVRSEGEYSALAVEVLREAGEIVMRTDKAELGRWPSADVTIEPLDSMSFSFIAETDRLVFVPDEHGLFAASPLVTVPVPDGGRRKRRKQKKEAAAQATPKDAEVSPPKKRGHAKGAASASRVVLEPAEEPDIPEPAADTPAESVVESETAALDAGPDADRGNATKRKRIGLWVRLLDVARHNRVLGLDRVPVDESLRGGDHEHTWDHRVAPRGGFASHVCTICGKIKF